MEGEGEGEGGLTLGAAPPKHARRPCKGTKLWQVGVVLWPHLHHLAGTRRHALAVASAKSSTQRLGEVKIMDMVMVKIEVASAKSSTQRLGMGEDEGMGEGWLGNGQSPDMYETYYVSFTT